MLEQRDEVIAPLFVDGNVEVRATELAASGDLKAAISLLLSKLDTDSGYVSVHAYLDRTSAPQAFKLREALAKRTSRPVTFGWGPRFLHSTGQYHKGGPKQGVYLQVVSSSAEDIAVPGREFTFGELIASQAAGDAKVLGALGLPVLTLTLSDVEAGLAQLAAAIG
jgi:glucose-6-phosphate isomerase